MALTAPTVVAAATVAVCVFVSWSDPTTPGGVIPVCPTKALLGITCPGCGSTRMLYSLIHGNVGAAVHFNAFACAMLIVLVVTYVMWTIACIRGKPAMPWYQMRWSPITILALVIAWTALRIIPIPALAGLRI